MSVRVDLLADAGHSIRHPNRTRVDSEKKNRYSSAYMGILAYIAFCSPQVQAGVLVNCATNSAMTHFVTQGLFR